MFESPIRHYPASLKKHDQTIRRVSKVAVVIGIDDHILLLFPSFNFHSRLLLQSNGKLLGMPILPSFISFYLSPFPTTPPVNRLLIEGRS